MVRRAWLVVAALALSSSWASADRARKPAVPRLPAVGERFTPGAWKAKQWVKGATVEPAVAAENVVVYVLCNARSTACADDAFWLSRSRKDFVEIHGMGADRFYVVAFVDGDARAAAALDFGVDRRAVAYGKDVTKLRKQLGVTTDDVVIITSPQGVVQLASVERDRNLMGPRETTLAATILYLRDFTITPTVSPSVKVGVPFDLKFEVRPASWAKLNVDGPLSLKLTVPPEWTCDALKLKRPQFVADATGATATIRCTSAKAGTFTADGVASFAIDLATGSLFDPDGNPVTWDVVIAP